MTDACFQLPPEDECEEVEDVSVLVCSTLLISLSVSLSAL